MTEEHLTSADNTAVCDANLQLAVAASALEIATTEANRWEDRAMLLRERVRFWTRQVARAHEKENT